MFAGAGETGAPSGKPTIWAKIQKDGLVQTNLIIPSTSFWENPGRAELVLLTSIRSLRPPWFTIRNPSIHHLHFYQGTTGNSFVQWFTQVANLLKCFAKNCSLVILQSLARNLTRNMLHVSRDVLMEADIPAGCRLWESSSTKYMCVALSIKEIQLQSGQSSNVD